EPRRPRGESQRRPALSWRESSQTRATSATAPPKPIADCESRFSAGLACLRLTAQQPRAAIRNPPPIAERAGRGLGDRCWSLPARRGTAPLDSLDSSKAIRE